MKSLDSRMNVNSSMNIRRTFNEIHQEYFNPNGRMLVASHRGDWRNYPENSISAIQSVIEIGVDIVETDVQKTLDGHLVLMHDSTVDRTTNGTGSVSNMTLQKIKELYLKDNLGGIGATVTGEKVPTLTEAMTAVEGHIMINIDKGWDLRDEIYDVLDALNLVNYCIIKGSASNSVVESWLDSKKIRPNYMAIFRNNTKSDIDSMLSGAAPEVIELIFEEENCTVISSTFLEKIKCNNKRIWMNTLWSSLCAGHTDDVSGDNPANGWGWVIDKGASIIQTDQPTLLIDYLNTLQSSA